MGHCDSGDKSVTVCWWHREGVMGLMLSFEWHRSTLDGSGTVFPFAFLCFSPPHCGLSLGWCVSDSPACEVPACSAAGAAPGHSASHCQQAGSAWAWAVRAGVRHCHTHWDSSEARQEADGISGEEGSVLQSCDGSCRVAEAYGSHVDVIPRHTGLWDSVDVHQQLLWSRLRPDLISAAPA